MFFQSTSKLKELSNYRDAGDELGQGCMLLSLAEATCAYRGSNKREEALANCEEARDIFHEARPNNVRGMAFSRSQESKTNSFSNF